MPVATIVSDTERFELKTLPGGFVIIKRMTYGQSLVRSSMSTKFLVGGSTNSKDFQGELDMQVEAVALWDFANCVVDHNLTDANDRPLNFKNAADVRGLDPRIGQEVGKYIDGINNFEDTDEVKN